MPSNTTYNPPNSSSLVKSALSFNSMGISITVTAGQSGNLDYTFTDDTLMTGAWIVTNNGNFGDNISLQVIDTTGAFTGIPGTIISTVISSWYLPSQTSEKFNVLYPAKMLTGMTLRAIYNSTGNTNVFVAVNYNFHKILE